MPESRTSRSGRPSDRSGSASSAVPSTPSLSIVRTALCALLVLLGIAWLVVYVTVAGPDTDGTTLTAMGDLGKWNYLIGFVLIFLGLALAAHPSTPLGRGRGVVIGMLGCFLMGLVWIVVYYVTSSTMTIPLLTDLSQYNLVVGIGFMAVGFVYATHWE
ncbi:MAG TPA: cell division protein CrgA [Nocardioidaceae bacterium]|nr:cell division protein CrgA [Nocardioidaceae bacterium]